MSHYDPMLLLDFDGVLNAVCRTPPDTHPSDSWIQTELQTQGRYWPLMVSEVVLDCLRKAGDNMEVIYLTSWRDSSAQFAEEFTLPEWKYADEDILDERPVTLKKYWKVEVARKLMEGNTRPVLWIDDDLPFMPGADELIAERNTVADIVTITPDTSTGLNSKELDIIEEFSRAFS